MKIFRDIPLGTKVFLAPGLLVAGMFTLAILGIYGLWQARVTLDAIREAALVRHRTLDHFAILSEQVQSDVYQIAVLHSLALPVETILPMQERLESRLGELNVLYGQMMIDWDLNPTEIELLARLKDPLANFHQHVQQVSQVILEDPALGVLLVRSSIRSFQELQVALDDFRSFEETHIDWVETTARERIQNITIWITVLTGAVTVTGIIIATHIGSHHIAGPIRSMTTLMTRLAGGDLDITVKRQRRKDEIGAMARAVEVFRENAILREKAEVALNENRRSLETLMGNLPGMAYRCQNNKDWTMEFLSAGCLTLTGYPPEDLVGNHVRSYAEMIHPGDQEMVWEIVQEALERNQPFEILYRINTAQGEEKWVWERGLGILGPGGELVALEGFISDVTDRESAQAIIRQTADQLARAIDLEQALTEAFEQNTIWVKLAEGLQGLYPDVPTIFIASYDEDQAMIRAVFGFQDGRILDSVALPPVHLAPEGKGTQSQVIRTRQPLIIDNHLKEKLQANQSTILQVGSDEAMTQSALYVPMLAQNKVIGVIQLQSYQAHRFSDADVRLLSLMANSAAVNIQNARLYELAQVEIVERKRAQEQLMAYSENLEEMVAGRTRELDEAQEQLIRRERLAVLGELAGSVAHELRNPLGVISNAVYYLKTLPHESGGVIDDYLQMIDAETNTASGIVRDLLGYTRIRPGQRQPVVIPDLVSEVFRRNPPPSEVHLEFIRPDDLPLALIDPRQIGQVLDNLVLNAYQAMPEGGSLAIHYSIGREELPQGQPALDPPALPSKEPLSLNTPYWLVLRIKDEGIGIPPRHLDKIFEPLFTTKARGIGLGLAISKKLAEANGGRIEVQSQPGQGTTFALWLPVV